MAFNPSPKVADARALAEKWGMTRVIVLMIDDEAGTMEYASYGKDKRLCGQARKVADACFDAAYRCMEGE